MKNIQGCIYLYIDNMPVLNSSFFLNHQCYYVMLSDQKHHFQMQKMRKFLVLYYH